MKLHVAIPTMFPEQLNECVRMAQSLGHECRSYTYWLNGVGLGMRTKDGWDINIGGSENNIGVTPALHHLFQLINSAGVHDEDYVLFLHDDVLIKELDWDSKILEWTSQYRPALFGFGAARGLGDPDLYQKPYQLTQLARREFISNMRDAEAHGQRVTVPQRVATLDLFSIGARMGFLRAIGGWSWWPHVHHSLDNAICLEAARRKEEVWYFPIACHHKGGQTSTKTDFVKDFGKPEGEIHSEGHVTLYERYRDVLPLYVPAQEVR